MELIGFVSSDSSESRCTVILKDGFESKVKNEDLVMIKNAAANRKLLAVCRGGRGVNDVVKALSYSPAIGYARTGRKPSSAREYFTYNLSIIGDVTDGSITQNRYIIAPASEVYLFDEEDNPMQLLGETGFTLGHYAGHKSWRIPVKPEYINYHIGVFGATGSGKSFLTRYEIVPLLRKVGYDVIIFDWKGSDYAPYFETVLRLEEVRMEADIVLKYFSSITRNFGYMERKENPVAQAVEIALRETNWRGASSPSEAKEIIKEKALAHLAKQRVKDDVIDLQTQRLEQSLNMIEDEDVSRFMGQVRPHEIIERVKGEGTLVIDMSKGSKHQKLAAFYSIANYLKRMMERKEELKLAIIVDEAPQYAPWSPSGMEHETTEILIELCALGRSYGLSVILLSQGISGEIGINAAVRRNLNTQIIGRIYPLDLEEAQKLMGSYQISAESLFSLPTGHFYLVGRLNPSPIPLLFSFDIGEVENSSV